MYARRPDTNIVSNHSQSYQTLYNLEYYVELVPPIKKFREELNGTIPNYNHDIPRGMITIRKLDRDRYKMNITARGLPPNSLFSFDNVIRMTPYTKSPLIDYGFNGFTSDDNGDAVRIVNIKTKPGLMILINYHTGDGLYNTDGTPSIVYPAILAGLLPTEFV